MIIIMIYAISQFIAWVNLPLLGLNKEGENKQYLIYINRTLLTDLRRLEGEQLYPPKSKTHLANQEDHLEGLSSEIRAELRTLHHSTDSQLSLSKDSRSILLANDIIQLLGDILSHHLNRSYLLCRGIVRKAVELDGKTQLLRENKLNFTDILDIVDQGLKTILDQYFIHQSEQILEKVRKEVILNQSYITMAK